MSVNPTVVRDAIRAIPSIGDMYYLMVHIANADAVRESSDGFLGVMFPITVCSSLDGALNRRIELVSKLKVSIAIVRGGDYLPLYIDPPSQLKMQYIHRDDMSVNEVKKALDEQVRRNRLARQILGNGNNKHHDKIIKEIEDKIESLNTRIHLTTEERDILRLTYTNELADIKSRIRNLSLSNEVLERSDVNSNSYIMNQVYAAATLTASLAETQKALDKAKKRIEKFNTNNPDSNWLEYARQVLTERDEIDVFNTINEYINS